MTRAVLAAIWLTACAPGVAANRVGPGDAILYVTSNVRDAEVYIDGRLVGPLDALRGGVAVAPGAHRLELRHEEYFSRYLEVRIARAARQKLVIDMAATLP